MSHAKCVRVGRSEVALIYSRVNYIFLQGNLNSTTSVDSGTFARRSNTLKHEFTP